jgi:hypothetical protein
MKTQGIDKFAERLDEIFEQGDPTKALILDAYNKAVGLPSLTKERVIREYPALCSTCNGTGTFYSSSGTNMNTSAVCPICDGTGKMIVKETLCLEPEKEDTKTKIINLLKEGRRIEAIKTYKDYMECGLQDAKYQVQLIDEEYCKSKSPLPDKKVEQPEPAKVTDEMIDKYYTNLDPYKYESFYDAFMDGAKAMRDGLITGK